MKEGGRRGFLVFLILVLVFLACPVWADAPELEGLRQEFNAMRQKMEGMQQKINQLEAQQARVGVPEKVEEPAKMMPWHGYISWNYEDETGAGKNPTFDAFALALIPTFTISDKVDVYAQIVYEHAPFYDISVSSSTGARSLDARSSGELVVNDAYLTYTVDEWLKLRAGKFATPYGLYNTLQYAGPAYITVKTPGRDTFYARGSATAEDSYFFGRYSMGAWVLGSYDIFSYDFYVANGRTRLAQHADDNRSKAIGGRLGVDLSLGQSHLKLVYSGYHDKLRAATTDPFFRQTTHALSSEFSVGDFKLISEIAESRRARRAMSSFYTLAQYNLTEKLTPFVQYQRYNRDTGAPGSNARYITGGLAYHIIPWKTFLKVQVDNVKPKGSREYNRYLLGLTTSF